jgi:phage repressor protein C with HTH and peptisase S24 domain
MTAPDPRARLLALAHARGASLAQLSALIGRNSSYLQQFVRKGSPRKLEETDRATLARFLGADESELGAPEDKSPAAGAKRWREDWVEVPRLALDASAGPGALAGEEQAIGSFRFAARWLRAQGLDPARLSAIAVAGDSMEPTLRDGDEILVDRGARPLRDGIHVVRVGEALMVKRLDTARPGRIALLSDNPAYRPVELAPDQLEVIGRVVWKSGRL